MKLFHVMAELFLALTGITGGSLGLDYGENRPVGIIQTEIGEAIPGCRVVARNRDFKLHLCVVAQIPARMLKLRVDHQRSGFGFVEVRHQ